MVQYIRIIGKNEALVVNHLAYLCVQCVCLLCVFVELWVMEVAASDCVRPAYLKYEDGASLSFISSKFLLLGSVSLV